MKPKERMRAQARSDYQGGMTAKEVGAKYGVAMTTVEKWAYRGGWKKRNSEREVSEIAALVELRFEEWLVSKSQEIVQTYLDCSLRIGKLCRVAIALQNEQNPDTEELAKISRALSAGASLPKLVWPAFNEEQAKWIEESQQRRLGVEASPPLVSVVSVDVPRKAEA